MYSIGEFSKITRLSIKSIRLYHDKKILIPAMVDAFTGYRYFDERNIETAGIIMSLKRFGLPLAQIKQILDDQPGEAGLLEYLKQRQTELKSKISEYTHLSNTIDQIIQMEKNQSTRVEFEIEIKTLETLLIAGYRMQGKYSDVGVGFKKIGKHFGSKIIGKPMTLYYDEGYVEDEADFEACFPVRKGVDIDDIQVRRLKGTRCASLIHQGPFENLGAAYQKLFSHINKKGYRTCLPFREVYLKGPGIIFKGNPNNYLTEVMIPLEDC